MPTENLFLAAIVLIGIPTSYEDLRSGKIRNVWIITGCIYAVLFYIIESFFRTLPLSAIFTNFIISSVAAFALWNFKYWSAGDAKLFSLYSLLVPIWIYHKTYFHFFPSFNILYYTFIPAAIYLFILGLTDLIKNIGEIKPGPSSINIFHVYLKRLSCFTSIFLANQLLVNKLSSSLISVGFESSMLFLILFFLYRPISIFFDKKSKKFISYFFISMFVVIIPVVFTNPSVWLKYILKNLFHSFILMAIADGYGKITSEHIARSKNKTLPFAPWIFLGSLITWFFV